MAFDTIAEKRYEAFGNGLCHLCQVARPRALARGAPPITCAWHSWIDTRPALYSPQDLKYNTIVDQLCGFAAT